MAFRPVVDLDAETTISLGGYNKQLKRNNPLSIEGYYLGNRQVASKKAKSGFDYLHYFQTPKGNVAVWGKTDLTRKLAGVSPGSMTRATFDKMQPTPNGEMYKYKVEVDAENTIGVPNLSSGSQTLAPESYDNVDQEDPNNDHEAQARAEQVTALLRKGR